MITELQKKTAQAIVRIFETGKPLGDYGAVTVIKGDTGHLSYGCSQASLASGNLGMLIGAYCQAAGAQYADQLVHYLTPLKHKDTTLDNNAALKSVLKAAGNDLVMRRVQNDFFDQKFWRPSVTTAEAMEVRSALGTLVIYDSMIHGSFALISDRTTKKHGSPLMIGEQEWIDHYIDERREWLKNHSNKLLRNTVYRANALNLLSAMERWELDLPITVRGVKITENMLADAPPQPLATPLQKEAIHRTLKLASPVMRGDDVKDLQARLNRYWQGQDAVRTDISRLSEDGVFGQKTGDVLRAFQSANNLKPDGICGSMTWAELDKYRA